MQILILFWKNNNNIFYILFFFGPTLGEEHGIVVSCNWG